jgi:hypothetical protein
VRNRAQSPQAADANQTRDVGDAELAPSSVRWRLILANEEQARQEVHESAQRRAGQGKAFRSWWRRVADVLFEYEKVVAGGGRPEPPPVILLRALCGQAGYLAVGKLPDTIRLSLLRGRTAPGPTEARQIGMAVAYWRACSPEGHSHNEIAIRIDDPDPVERIHLWYGVAKRTVYDWLARFDPAYLGVNDVNSELLIKFTVTAAEQHRAAGRSQAAISRRARKRKHTRARK